MSWFSDITSKLQEVTEQVTEQAKSALPLDQQMLEKLTLTTPELDAERKRIDEEERRKEHIRDCLAGMLPWETRDPERDILVEECKEAILKLSNDPATFKGPYRMPTLTVKLSESEEGKEGKEKGDDEEEEEEEQTEKEEIPSEESLDKLAVLEPLPKLLGHFDLDAHVGLIQRLLSEDPNLVTMQSKLSGGGEREQYFWKNYFFHCAFARYEAGLSIDEIWNDEDPADRKAKQDAEAAKKVAEEANKEEETITFEHRHDEPAKASSIEAITSPAVPKPKASEVVPFDAQPAEEPAHSSSAIGNLSVQDSTSEFEKLDADNLDADFGDDDNEFDVELDELEAEIAAELAE